jgi:hypothetical protein
MCGGHARGVAVGSNAEFPRLRGQAQGAQAAAVSPVVV